MHNMASQRFQISKFFRCGVPPNPPRRLSFECPNLPWYLYIVRYGPENIVDTQYRNEALAIFGKGPYEIRPEFQHLAVDDDQWSELSNKAKIVTFK